MSHLSILPTALTDLNRLESVLISEGYTVCREGVLPGFAGENHAFALMATSPCGIHFAWRRADGSSTLELLADVERQGAAETYQPRLQRIVRLYALAEALDDAIQIPALKSVIAQGFD